MTDVGTMTKSNMKVLSASLDKSNSLRYNGGWQFLQRPNPKTDSSIQFYNAQSKTPKNPVLVAQNRTQ